MRRIGLAVLAAALLGAAPQPGVPDEPRARAWAVRVVLTSAAGEVVRIAEVSAESGEAATATGSPLAVAGQDPNRVVADRSHPDARKVLHEYVDPTSSMTTEGGFAEAHVSGSSSSARAGFAAMNGSGFALANELFTFEQQEQTLNQWADLMSQIFTPLNEQIDAINGVLDAAGLSLPELHGIAPEGLVDVGRARQLASSAATSSSPGFSSARADTSIGEVRLFGGFLELRGVSAEATSESVAGADTREATARVGAVYLGGLEVVADGDGFRLAGNDLVSRALVQPALDVVLTALADGGLTIRAVDERAQGDLREATAFEVSLASPAGVISISVAHAEASAASVGAPLDPEPVVEVDPPVVDPPTVSAGGATGGGAASGDGGTVLPDDTTPRASWPILRRAGPAEARAMRTAYLLTVIAAAAASLLIPMMLRRSRRTSKIPLVEGASR